MQTVEKAHDRAMPAGVDRDTEMAEHNLEAALEERDAARRHYEASIGTSVELRAYTRLRAASQKVTAADKWLRWAEGDFVFPPPPDDAVMDELLPTYG
jgi:hypothetical protein